MDLGLIINIGCFGILLLLQILISVDEAKREKKATSFNVIEIKEAA